MKFYPAIRKIILLIVVIAWAAIPFSVSFLGELNAAGSVEMPCPSGHSAARLTGWTLNDRVPSGAAEYNESTRMLTVSVDSVSLPDGRVLSVFIGEDRIGELRPLKDGEATGTITRELADGARVRVFDEDRPVVSANLQCTEAPTATPTVVPTISPQATPTPTPGGTATPTPTPSPTSTVAPAPSGEPTPDPMPKNSPAPSPSPGI